MQYKHGKPIPDRYITVSKDELFDSDVGFGILNALKDTNEDITRMPPF